MFTYNRETAVEYARLWAFGRNPKYHDFSSFGGDCTNFVSQCLYAGNMPMEYGIHGWFYKSLSSRSASWSGVQFLYEYLMRKRIAREVDLSEMEQGDIIQLSHDGSVFSHSLLIVEPDLYDPRVAAHSDDCFGRRLSDYEYQKARYLHISNQSV